MELDGVQDLLRAANGHVATLQEQLVQVTAERDRLAEEAATRIEQQGQESSRGNEGEAEGRLGGTAYDRRLIERIEARAARVELQSTGDSDNQCFSQE